MDGRSSKRVVDSLKRQSAKDHVLMVLKAYPTSMTDGTSVLATLIFETRLAASHPTREHNLIGKI